MEKGSYEARLWLKDYYHQSVSLPIVGSIYDFIIYRKICLTCTDEEVYMLNNLTNKYGMSHGLTMTINEIQQKLISEEGDKRRQVSNLSYQNPIQQKYEQQQFDNEMAEAMLDVGLTIDQLKKRTEKYPFNGGNIHTIPESILKSQKIIDQGTYQGKIKYVIYDKIYGCWSAEITAPHIKVPMIRKVNLADVKSWVTTAIKTTYLNNEKAELTMISQTVKTIKKPKLSTADEKQIQKIKDLLKRDNNNPLNNDNIF